jgi:uncharacterized protein (DUF1330 family)
LRGAGSRTEGVRDYQVNSEAYQNIAKHRKLGAIYHGLIVEGVS